MLDDWRCKHILRPRNLALRSTLYVTMFISLALAVFVLRATDRQVVLQTLLNVLPLLENHQNGVLKAKKGNPIGPFIQRPATATALQRTNQQTSAVILYWTKFFESSDFEVGLGSKPFAPCIDQVMTSSNCLTTTDRGLLNDSHAVVFHGRDLHVDDLPPIGWRRPHQMFIFFLLESPVHTDLDLLQQPVFRNYFNRTMTYRRDSDFVELHAYGRMRCITSSPSCLEFPRHAAENGPESDLKQHHSHNSDPSVIFSPNETAVTSSKDRVVAWFVSNCQSNSQRESLVRRLSKFIAVDVYGECGDGKLSCPNQPECDRMLSRHYRFYLSFENSLCPDYITEKLYRPLAHDTVPIVYGGADYSLYLPASSYINAMDFKSAEALADHLKKLMANDTLYSSYFDWKKQYVVDRTPSDGWCRLCHLLWEPSSTKNNVFVEDVASWWSGAIANQTCSLPPKSLV